MKILHILKSEPDRNTRSIISVINQPDDVQAMETLSKCFDIIFETELDGWCTDETLWPKNRSFKTFRNWFSFEFHSLVEDLCGYEIIDDESV